MLIRKKSIFKIKINLSDYSTCKLNLTFKKHIKLTDETPTTAPQDTKENNLREFPSDLITRSPEVAKLNLNG